MAVIPALTVPVLIAALALAPSPPSNTCISGDIAPRVTWDDLKSASDVVVVRIESVAMQSPMQCDLKAVVEGVERGSVFAVGQTIDNSTRCADNNTVLHPDVRNQEWLYSDLPKAGERGRLYYHNPGYTPPGPFFVREGGDADIAETKFADSGAGGCGSG